MAVQDHVRSGRHTAETQVPVKLVDADVHPTIDFVTHAAQLGEFIPEPWRSRYYKRWVAEVEVPSVAYMPTGNFIRRDCGLPQNGGTTDEVAAQMEKQLLIGTGADIAICEFTRPRPKMQDGEWENALFSGHNAWQAEVWHGRHNWHGRFRGGIKVSPWDVPGAVREIERWAGHPYFVSVQFLPESSTGPFGRPEFRPLFEAAVRHGLPVSMHITAGVGMHNLTPVGFPVYWLAAYAQWPLRAISQLTSLIFEGVFERFPTLKVAIAETGFTWLTPLCWRLDNYWRRLGGAVPEVKRPPSEYIRDHVRLTTQPMDEADARGALKSVIEWMGADPPLMFSTDYPHYDYDDPSWAEPRLPKDTRDKILFENALEFYGLPRERPLDALDAAGEEGE